MKTICLENEVSYLGLDKKIIDILNNHEIKLIKDLWGLGRKDLKKIGLLNKQINDIIIKMQLNGFDLNKKMY